MVGRAKRVSQLEWTMLGSRDELHQPQSRAGPRVAENEDSDNVPHITSKSRNRCAACMM